MSDDPLIGKRFNQYEIEAVLGTGGMSTVYRAYQHGVNRTVAIKVLPGTLMHDLGFLERFKREAEIIARLEHFHILPVYDAGEWDGIPYIVMRYLSGGTLADRLSPATTIPPEGLLPVVRQVCDALDYAHEHGIIHRDVKPSNIMFDDRRNAYLSDFGLAGVGQAATSTGTGVFGTPEYLAPEISAGLEITPSVDIYSLGVILFQAFTGRLPFEADSAIKLAMMHVQKPVPLPRSFNKYLSANVEAVVMQTMAKEPEGRYASAGAVANALAQAIQMGEEPAPATKVRRPPGAPAEPPSAPPTEHPQTTQPLMPVRTPRIPWLLIGMAIIAIIAVLFVVQFNVQQQADQAATQAIQANQTQVAASTLNAAFIATQTSVAGTLSVALRPTVAHPSPTPTATATSTATSTPTPTMTIAATVAGPPLGGGGGSIAYVTEQTGNPEIFIMNLASGQQIQVTNNKVLDLSPVWSPDGKMLAFVSQETQGGTHIFVTDDHGQDKRELTKGFQTDLNPGWIGEKEIAFLAQDGTRTILRKVNTDGEQKDILQVNPGMIVSVLDWLPGGAGAIYYGYIPRGDVEIARLDTATSAVTNITETQGEIEEMSFSPDRSLAVYTATVTGRKQLFLADTNCPIINQCNVRRLTDDSYSYHTPRFSPDGKLLLVTSNRSGNDDLWILDLTGKVVQQVTDDPAKDGDGAWQPAG